jgi:hypothetical protein
LELQKFIFVLKGSDKSNNKYPPARSKTLLADVFNFLIYKPKENTLIKFNSEEERIDYNHRIMQRTGIDPNRFSVLNIHRIGVNAPVSFVFNELLQWNGDSTCWPNHIAKVDRIADDLKSIRILPFGWKKYPLNSMKSLFGLQLIPLFNLNAIRIQGVPGVFDQDNNRYLLYECSGGYPIGIYTMYVRSSIPSLGEKSNTQLFFAVGFNFYGKEDWKKRRKLINKIWEIMHNRVTSNVLNRIKQLGEWRIETIQNSG